MLSLLKPRAATDSSRERLRLAKQGLAQKRQALADEHADAQRKHEIVQQGDDSARAAANDKRAVEDFRRECARSGFKYSDALELRRLEDKAAESAKTAEHDMRNADAVRVELKRAESNIESAQVEVRGAEDGITAAVAIIAVQENSQLLEELVQDAERFLATREKVMGLHLAIVRPWSLPTKNTMDPAHEAISIVESAIDRASIASWGKHVDDRRDPQGFLDAIAAPWRVLVAKLRCGT